MATVTNTIKLPDGTAPTYATAKIELVASTNGSAAAGWINATDVTVLAEANPTVTAGAWSASLTPNADIDPSGTVYRVTEHAGRNRYVHYIEVDADGGTVHDLLTDGPGDLTFASVTAHNDDTDAHSGLFQLTNMLDVREYGAVGGLGLVDDTTAIQSAIDAAVTAGGGVVYLPAGIHSVTGLTIDASSVTLRGAGRRLSVLKCSGGDGITIESGSSIRYVNIERLHVQSNGATGSGIKTVDAVECSVRNVTVTAFTGSGKYGLEITGDGDTFLNAVTESTFAGCANGVYVSGQAHTFTSCRLQGNAADGLYDDSTGTTFVGCDFEGNDRHGCYLFQNRNKQFLGCYWESNGVTQVYSNSTQGLLISGGTMSGGVDATPHGVRLGVGGADSGVAIIGLNAKSHPTADIDIVNCTDGAILGCRLESATTVLGSFGTGIAQITGSGIRLSGLVEPFDGLTTGEEVLGRDEASGSVAAANSGQLILTYFTAKKSEAWAKQRFWTTATAAAATPTLVRAVAYEVAADGTHTQVAASANDTSKFAAQNTEYDFTWATPTTRVAGRRYAVGVLIVTAGAMPTLVGVATPASNSAAAMWALAPRACSLRGSLSDLPSSPFASNTLSNTTRRVQSVCLPS